MKIADGGVKVFIVSDPFIDTTRNGNTKYSGFSIFTKRRKVQGGGWEDDPYYEPLRISLVAFGETAEYLRDNGAQKGASILITEGTVQKPARENVDVEIVIYAARVVERGNRQQPRQRQRRGGGSVRSANQSIPEAFDNLPGAEDLPF